MITTSYELQWDDSGQITVQFLNLNVSGILGGLPDPKPPFSRRFGRYNLSLG